MKFSLLIASALLLLTGCTNRYRRMSWPSVSNGHQSPQTRNGKGGGGKGGDGGGGGTVGTCFQVNNMPTQQLPGVLSLDPTKWCWIIDGALAQPPQWDSTTQTSYAVIPVVANFVLYTNQTQFIGHYFAGVTGNISASSGMAFSVRLENTGAPVFNYAFEPSNTCIYDAHARLEFADGGSNAYDRWWSNPIAFDLQTAVSGSDYVFTTPLDPGQWSDADGILGSSIPTQFKAAASNLQHVDLSFGGGCFFGHGINVSGGTSTFHLLDFRVQ